MISGRTGEDDNVFCVECWKRAEALGGPVSVLDTTNSEAPADATPFWVVDPCVLCGANVNCKDIKRLA